MMRGMFAAISGLKTHQVMLDVTSNDIANVNTIGYKSARTTFKDALTQLQRGASGPGRVRRVLHLGFCQHDASRVDRQGQESKQHGQQKGRQHDDHAAPLSTLPRPTGDG